MMESSSTQVPARKLPQYTAAIIATIGAFAMGNVIGWSAPAIELIKKDITLSTAEISWINSISNLGGAVVMLPMAFILDRLGRKVTMLGLAPLMFFSWLLLAFVHYVPAYILARFLTGFFGAAYSVGGPIYNGEIAQKEIRGILGIFYQLFLCGGVLFSYVIGYFGHLLTLTLTCASIPIVFFIAFLFMPETPLYLLTKGHKEEAAKSLQWLRGKEYNIQEEFRSIEEFVLQTKNQKIPFKDAIKSRPAVRALILSAGVMVFQQCSGIKATVYYTVTIFIEAGSKIDPYVCTIIVGAVLTVATAVSAVFVDNFGRRPLLIISEAMSAINLALIGFYFHIKSQGNEELAESINWLPLTCMCLYLVVYSLGLGACSWVLLGELFPTEIKDSAGSFCTFINWFLAFIVTITFPHVSEEIGSAAAFWIFAVVCVIGLAFVYFFVIETKGKSLEEIQMELKKSYF